MHISTVSRSRPFSTKQTPGCRQKESKTRPAEAPTPTHSCPKKHQALDMLAAINFYLVKAQGVPVASIDPVCGTRITRLQLGCPGVPCCLACKSAQKPLAQAYKHLERPQIQLDSAPTPRPPHLHFLLSNSGLEIVCTDCYQPPVSGLTVISCLCMSRRVTPSFLSKSLHSFQQERLCQTSSGSDFGRVSGFFLVK